MAFQPEQADETPTDKPEPVLVQPLEVLYWPQLDGLRALAFLMVFLTHQTPFLVSPEAASIPGVMPVVLLINWIIGWGWMGVDVFFVLSAFLITTLLLRERAQFGNISFPQFFMRRMLRIWPLYFLILLLGFFILPACQYYQYPWGSPEWKAMISSYLPAFLLFLGNMKLALLSKAPIADSLRITWSVAMEEQFYLVWGLILTRVQQLKTLTMLIIMLIPFTLLLRLSVYFSFHHPFAFYYNPLTHLDPLLVGISIAILFHANKLPVTRLESWGAVLFLAPILLYLGLGLGAPNLDKMHISMVLIMSLSALGAGSFLLALLYWPPAKRLFSIRPLIWLGRLSFGLYLFHPLAKHLTDSLILDAYRTGIISDQILAWILSLLCGLITTVLFAWLSWHLLEKHCSRLRKHFMRVPSGSL